MNGLQILLKYFPVHFIVFFTIAALAANRLLRDRRYRLAAHAVFGFMFVAIYGGFVFAAVVLLEITVTYVIAKTIREAGESRTPKIVLAAVGTAIPLFILTVSKYADLRDIYASAGIVYAIGISYFTFKLIHVVIDAYRGMIKDISFTGLAALVFFYPTFTAGPIERYNHFMDNAVKEGAVEKEDIEEGTRRIIYGLFKKFILADQLYYIISAADLVNMDDKWLLISYLYMLSLKIYFDFSGYTDIAVGLSRFFGIRVFENFDRPYVKWNITLFWQSWHMTLTGWLRDYVYLPVAKRLVSLTKNRLPLVNNAVAQLVTMSLVGIWHGSTANYLIWGLYHGAGLSLYRAYSELLKRVMPQKALEWMGRSRLLKAIGIVLTFNYVTFGWIFFTYDVKISGEIISMLFK